MPDRCVVSPAVFMTITWSHAAVAAIQERSVALAAAAAAIQERSVALAAAVAIQERSVASAAAAAAAMQERPVAPAAAVAAIQDRSGAGLVTLNRYQDRSGAGFVTLNRYQGPLRARDAAVAWSGTWQGQDRDVARAAAGACFIALNVLFAAGNVAVARHRDVKRSPKRWARNIIIDPHRPCWHTMRFRGRGCDFRTLQSF